MNVALTIIHNFLRNLTGFAIKRPALFVVVSLIMTGLAAFYIGSHIEVHTDTDEMINPELPFRQTFHDFNAAFPQFNNSFIIVIDGETPEAAVEAQELLAAYLSARKGLYKSVYAPGAGAFFDQNGFLYLDFDQLVDLSDQLAAAEPVLAAVSEDPSLRGLFDILSEAMEEISEGDAPPEKLTEVLGSITASTRAAANGREQALSWRAIFLDDEDLAKAKRRLLIVQPELDFTQLQSAKAALAGARAAAREVAQETGTLIRFSGKMALSSDELKSVADGAILAGALFFILVALVLGFGIRSARLVFAALTTLFAGLIWTGAFALLAIGYLNIISIAFAVLFIGLGIDFAIHFSLRYQEEVQGGLPVDQALIKTSVTVGAPLALCAPTTALAFYAFMATDYVGLAQLGLISGTGMFISFFTSLTFLPALLKLMPLKKGKVVFNIHARQEAGFIAKNGRRIALAGLGFGLASVYFAAHADFDFDPINLKDPKSESVTTFFDLMAGEKTSPYTIQILAASEGEALTLKERLTGLPEVDDVIILQSYVPERQEEKLEVIDTISIFLNPVFTGRGSVDPPSWEENAAAVSTFREKVSALEAARPGLPVTAAAMELSASLEGFGVEMQNGAAEQALLQQNLFSTFPRLVDQLDAALGADYVTLGDLPEEITSRYRADDGRFRVEVFPSADLSSARDLERFVAAVSALASEASGSPVQIFNSGLVVKGAMIEASTIAVVAMVLFLTLILRRVSSVTLITLPVFLAGLLTLAAMTLLGLKFNFANVIVIPLLIGLGVDSGIHLVLRAREEKENIRLLSSSTPRAVLLSALTTLGSFGTLAISAHQGTASMGILLALAIVMILIATLLVLPGLMIWLQNAGKTAKN